MKIDEWVTPDIPRPRSLTENERRIIHREITSGASAQALAEYFNTTVARVRGAKKEGDQRKWGQEPLKKSKR